MAGTTNSENASEVVIFVHGTGAGDASDRGVKWWQTGSPFSDTFSAAVGVCAAPDRPFHWSGNNSESERRSGGQALLARLYRLETAAVRYHLIGHSHGGSVIWHALVGSARDNRRLHGLKGWATVGTPFLKFAALRASLWRWIAATVPSGLAIWIFTLAPLAEWLSAFRALWDGGEYLGLAVFLILFSALVLLVLWALWRIVLPAVSGIADLREKKNEDAAANWYGDLWLALWHPLDEPINSLAGTLGDAPPITPRVARDGIFGVIPLAGAVINGLLARAADQFAWKLITDRAQGADQRGYGLLSVGRAPPSLAPGFEPLAPELASAMAMASDVKSVDSVRRLRELLESAYDSEGSEIVFDRVATVISFQEIIHTSYFEYPEIAKMLAAHVQSTSTARAGPEFSDVGAIERPVLPRRIATVMNRPRGSSVSRRSLELVVAALFFIGPAIVLSVGARGAFQGTVAPLTTVFQVDQIAATLNEAKYLSAGKSAIVGDMLLRLDALNRVSDPIAVIDRIPQAEPRWRAAIRLAHAFGRTGEMPEIERLLRRSEPADAFSRYADTVKVSAFAGYADSHGARRDDRFTALASDFINRFTTKADPRDYLRMSLARMLLARLDSSNLPNHRAAILDFIQRNVDASNRYSEADLCEFVRPVARSRAQENPRESLAAVVNICPLEDRRSSIMQNAKRDLILLGDKAKLQDFYAANGLSFMNAEQIEDQVKKNVEANEAPGRLPSDPFVTLVPDLVQLEAQLNDEIEADLRDYNSWPHRLGWTRFSDFLRLAKTMRRFGALRIAGIFAEVAADSVSLSSPSLLDFSNPEVAQRMVQRDMEQFSELVETLAELDRADLAKKRSDEMVAQAQIIPEQHASIRLIAYGEIARAAAARKDATLAKWVAEQALAIPLKDLNFEATTNMLNVADGLYGFDVKLARGSLQRAEQMVDLVEAENGRSASLSEIARLWAKFGDIRLARLAAAKSGSSESEMKAYVDILDAILIASDSSAAQKFAVGKFKVPLPADVELLLNRTGSIF